MTNKDLFSGYSQQNYLTFVRILRPFLVILTLESFVILFYKAKVAQT